MTKRRRRSAKSDSDAQQLCFGWDCVDFPFILKEALEQRGERSATVQGLVQFLFDRIESATGTCTVEQDVIAAHLNCTRPTVSRLVTRAEKVLGWIEIRSPARRGKGTTYWVDVAKVIADAGTSPRVDKALDEAKSRQWIVVDMKRDWSDIFVVEKAQDAND